MNNMPPRLSLSIISNSDLLCFKAYVFLIHKFQNEMKSLRGPQSKYTSKILSIPVNYYCNWQNFWLNSYNHMSGERISPAIS